MLELERIPVKKSPHTLPTSIINLFFVIGLLSALSFRLLLIVQEVTPELFKAVWYCGIIGYILFFSFRYAISQKRKKAIVQSNLIEQLNSGKTLSEEDRLTIVYLLSSIKKSRENLNYMFIFLTSAIAVLYLRPLNPLNQAYLAPSPTARCETQQPPSLSTRLTIVINSL